jgi:transposase InsO family protein
MHCHPNARLTPRGRSQVFLAVENGMTVSAACTAFKVSRRWYYRWWPRWEAQGHKGLLDRSSRPGRSPQRLSLDQEAHIAELRQRMGWGPDVIGAWLGIPPSTVHRAIRRLRLQAPKVRPLPAVRYEYQLPGQMIHVDTKKLGRIGRGPGHRAHGDRATRNRGIGWEVMHVAVDDATRLTYSELLPDESGRTAALFLVRALRWFREQGFTTQRVLTDNGNPYRSKSWRRVCRLTGVRHRFTRPYHPQTNGKVERWIRSVLSESLYLEVFNSADQRRLALQRYLRYYNDHRPHLGIGGIPPRQRLLSRLAA